MKREEIFPQLPLPPELAYDFLGTFARCEYALKTSGFAKAKRNSVEADWDNFAKEVGKHFARIEDDEFKSAVAYLIAEPPRKQVLHEGRLSWKDSPPNAKNSSAQQTLLMVRRVRNNLFHGAKIWSPERRFEGDRDERLVRSALTVLKHCMEHRRTRMAFMHGIF